jgi:bifunctional NMN adenylyltransferase/nudix hydrolase
MRNYKYDYLVFIGRFEPPHIGHIEVIKHALSLAQFVVVLVGSANQPRTIKNPWTYTERVAMIHSSFDYSDPSLRGRIVCEPLRDQKYNDQKWASSVQEIVKGVIGQRLPLEFDREPDIGVIGHTKDESSYYLKLFPQWELVEHSMNEHVNATDLRTLLFEGKNIKYLQGVLPPSVFEKVQQFTSTADFKLLTNEYDVIKKYKKAWIAAPYAPTFVTVDAMVIQSGHVLLVQRDAAPGEGLFALPGGFLEQNEYIVDGMLRELKEETKIKVAPAMLRGSIKQSRVFDRPDRSDRGRTITHAYLIELPPGELPQVKGSDDARKAQWTRFYDVHENKMF